jgi:hypothetical protein
MEATTAIKDYNPFAAFAAQIEVSFVDVTYISYI